MGVQAVLDCQARLIAALDAYDPDTIQSASDTLSAAMEDLRLHRGSIDQSLLELGLKQVEVARIRVKYLTAWNRQKIDRLADHCGQLNGKINAKPHEPV